MLTWIWIILQIMKKENCFPTHHFITEQCQEFNVCQVNPTCAIQTLQGSSVIFYSSTVFWTLTTAETYCNRHIIPVMSVTFTKLALTFCSVAGCIIFNLSRRKRPFNACQSRQKAQKGESVPAYKYLKSKQLGWDPHFQRRWPESELLPFKDACSRPFVWIALHFMLCFKCNKLRQ